MRRIRYAAEDRGAASVEFALVMPILVLTLFGIIDYGIYFADTLAIRQATADGARLASQRDTLASWDDPGTCPTTWVPDPTAGTGSGNTTRLRALACAIRQDADTLSDQVYVKIRVLDGTTLASGTPTSATGDPNWVPGNVVRICLLQEHSALLGLVPVPGQITGRADMPIEDPDNLMTLTEGHQELPGGTAWPSWC
jgi:hypothetical protein